MSATSGTVEIGLPISPVEVIGPDMVQPAWPETNARAVIQPQPAPLRLLRWNLQALAPPDAFDTLVVHAPAFRAQQRRDPPITIAAILPGQADDSRRKRCFIIRDDWLIALRRPWLAKNLTGMAFTHPVRPPNVPHTATAALGAYQFPSAASFKISLSSVRSATARLRRAFSRSSSLKRRA